MTLVPISRETHADKRVCAPKSYAFVRDQAVVPLYGSELARAAHEFPICFTHGAEGYFPAALMAFEPGRNLFVNLDGQWLGGYLPAVLRRAPFTLARIEDRDDWVLCLDDASELVSTAEGQPLFMEDGQPSQFIGQITEFLVGLERARQATLTACAALAKHELIVPWALQINQPGQAPRRVEGLFKIDEAKIGQVAAEALLELRDSGGLPVAYAQLFSLLKLPVLGRLAEIHAQLEASRKPAAKPAADLDRVFGIGDDDPFQFNF